MPVRLFKFPLPTSNSALNDSTVLSVLDCVWNVMAHAQKPDFVFRWNGRVHLNRQGRQFSRLLAADVCASAVVMLDTRCSELVWRVLATHSIRQFPPHFPTRASPFAITFQLDSTKFNGRYVGISKCTIAAIRVGCDVDLHDIYSEIIEVGHAFSVISLFIAQDRQLLVLRR
jgi:hypothetical protein